MLLAGKLTHRCNQQTNNHARELLHFMQCSRFAGSRSHAAAAINRGAANNI
jgi:hypothetical protein